MDVDVYKQHWEYGEPLGATSYPRFDGKITTILLNIQFFGVKFMENPFRQKRGSNAVTRSSRSSLPSNT